MAKKSISFTDFIVKLGEAGYQANKACEEYTANRLQELCTIEKQRDGTKVYIPKTVKVKVGEKITDVPLISLIAPHTVMPDGLTVEFESTINMDDENPKMLFHRRLFRKGVDLKVKAKFKAADQLETVELIRDQLNLLFDKQMKEG